MRRRKVQTMDTKITEPLINSIPADYQAPTPPPASIAIKEAASTVGSLGIMALSLVFSPTGYGMLVGAVLAHAQYSNGQDRAADARTKHYNEV